MESGLEEQVARQAWEDYTHNMKYCTVLGYIGFGMLGVSAIDVLHTQITGEPIVSQYLKVNSVAQEYFLNALLTGIGVYAIWASRSTQKVLKKELNEKISKGQK